MGVILGFAYYLSWAVEGGVPPSTASYTGWEGVWERAGHVGPGPPPKHYCVCESGLVRARLTKSESKFFSALHLPDRPLRRIFQENIQVQQLFPDGVSPGPILVLPGLGAFVNELLDFFRGDFAGPRLSGAGWRPWSAGRPGGGSAPIPGPPIHACISLRMVR